MVGRRIPAAVHWIRSLRKCFFFRVEQLPHKEALETEKEKK